MFQSTPAFIRRQSGQASDYLPPQTWQKRTGNCNLLCLELFA